MADKAGFKNLTACEQKLLAALPIGQYADCRSENDEDNDPSKGDQWPESRQIRPELIRWLCVNEQARKLIDPEGIKIYGAKFSDPVDLDFISVPFEIDIEKSRFSNELSLLYAHIAALYMMGSYLVNRDGDALNADGVKVEGSVFLSDGFSATGGVILRQANVGSILNCQRGIFGNPNGPALYADGIKVASEIFLSNGFTTAGDVILTDANVGVDLNVSKAIFAPGSSLKADGANVKGTFWWTEISDGSNVSNVSKPPEIYLDLIDMSAGSLTDDEKSWPAYLGLSGFTYDHSEMEEDNGMVAPRDADSGLRWLRRQFKNQAFATQPYEQFAKVLASEGNDTGARKIRIAMEDDLRAQRPWYEQIWPFILKNTIGYGYQPWLALWWASGLVLFGYLSFSLGYRSGVIAPTDTERFEEFSTDKLSPTYQSFNGFVYSLDTFLPIINLRLKDHWMPDPGLQPRANPLPGTWLRDFVGTHLPFIAERSFFKSGAALRAYYWIHLLLGWVLITLFAAGFTGIIRR